MPRVRLMLMTFAAFFAAFELAAEPAKPISALELNSSIPATDKVTLKVPAGAHLKGISVDVTVAPETSGLTIYGYTGANVISAIPVKGGETSADWPFVRPDIWVKRPPGTTYEIVTLGYHN
jgi:hypothetical protein